MVDDIALLAESFVKVIITVVPVRGPLDPAPDPGAVGEFEGNFRGVPAGVEVD